MSAAVAQTSRLPSRGRRRQRGWWARRRLNLEYRPAAAAAAGRMAADRWTAVSEAVSAVAAPALRCPPRSPAADGALVGGARAPAAATTDQMRLVQRSPAFPWMSAGCTRWAGLACAAARSRRNPSFRTSVRDQAMQACRWLLNTGLALRAKQGRSECMEPAENRSQTVRTLLLRRTHSASLIRCGAALGSVPGGCPSVTRATPLGGQRH